MSLRIGSSEELDVGYLGKKMIKRDYFILHFNFLSQKFIWVILCVLFSEGTKKFSEKLN